MFLPLSLLTLPLTHLSKAELKVPLLSPRTQAPRQNSPGLLFSESLLALWECLPAPGPRKAAHHVLLSPPRVHSSPLRPFPATPFPHPSLVLAPRPLLPNLSMVTAAPCRSQMATGEAQWRLLMLSILSLPPCLQPHQGRWAI